MLPTQTLNPTSSSSGAPAATGTGKLRKRYHGGDDHIVEEKGDGGEGERLMGNLKRKQKDPAIDADRLWWIGVGMTALGGVAYYSF